MLVQVLLWGWVRGSELTFELPDNAKQCFYEDITIGTKCTLEFQVSEAVCSLTSSQTRFAPLKWIRGICYSGKYTACPQWSCNKRLFS